MSAPPAGAGNAPRRPPGPRKPKVNPLVARKRPIPKPALSQKPKVDQNAKEDEDRSKYVPTPDEQMKLDKLKEDRKRNNGWSHPPPTGHYQEFDLITTKRSLLEDMRFHIMRLSKGKGERANGETTVDVTNQDQFPRPVTLHRRDPRLPPVSKVVVQEDPNPAETGDDAEAERLRQEKAEREAQRALDKAQIAPIIKSNEPKKQQQQKKEKAAAFYGRHSEEHKKQSSLRYEETLPWHLEDAEGKAGVWVGSYIASLSDTNCALVIDGDRFRMIPLERFYRFDEKPPFATMSLDAAENMMLQGKDVKRWVMIDQERQAAEKEKDETRQFLRGRTRVKTESATSRRAPKGERQDDYDIDISGDEFQDDDEAPGFEADDEDSKEVKQRIRREQVGANLFGEGEESKVDEEEREKELEKLKRKMMGKQTMKGLVKLEHAMDYDNSDSENEANNPFTESSESESDEEEKKEEEVKRDEEAKKTAEVKDVKDAKDAKDAGASGATSKGNTTPSGKQKLADKKGKLKRPGSPNLSDSSGAESTRKKVKTGKGTSSKAPSRSATPLPGRPRVGGATSDGEATAGEGSDGGLKLKKKIKIKTGTGAGGSPSASRAGSPAPPNDLLSAQVASPKKADATTPHGSSGPGQPGDRVEAWEIVQAVAAHQPISLGNLLRKFLHRIDKPGTTTKTEWIHLVRQNAEFGLDKNLRSLNKS